MQILSIIISALFKNNTYVMARKHLYDHLCLYLKTRDRLSSKDKDLIIIVFGSVIPYKPLPRVVQHSWT